VILILNNIVFPEIMDGTLETRKERWLRFIEDIKRLSRCPIIVFCGWHEGDPVSMGCM
jgi:hypothetical protein